MSKRTLTLLLVAALAGGAGLLASQRWFAPERAPLAAVTSFNLLASPRVLPPFVLQQSDGTPLDNAELQGHWTLVFLGFTHCPDICPTTLAQFAGAQKLWASLPETTRPRVLFVSADPERDSPELTGRYAHAFHVDTLAATAPIPQLETFTRSLSMVFMKVPGASGKPEDYSIDHFAGVIVLDPQARMAGVIQPPFDIKAIAADLDTLSKAAP